MRVLIIDGHNAIHNILSLRKELNNNHENARYSLIRLVDSWRFKKNYTGKIYIVFDGKDDYSHLQHFNNKGPVSIIFSKTNESADSRIVSMVKNAKDKSIFTIATNDEKDIGSVCRSLGAKIISPNFLIKKQPLNTGTHSNNKESNKNLNPKKIKEINDDLKKIWDIS